MIDRFALGTAVALLGGCAVTPHYMLSRPPEAVLASAHSAAAVAACIADAWEGTQSLGGQPNVVTRAGPESIRVTLRLGSNLQYIAEVAHTPTGSRTTVWHAVLVSIGGRPAGLVKAEACQ